MMMRCLTWILLSAFVLPLEVPVYHIEIFGGNDEMHGKTLSFQGAFRLPIISTGPMGRHDQPVVISSNNGSTPSNGTLLVWLLPYEGGSRERGPTYLTLQSAKGQGDFRLTTTGDSTPQPGETVLHDDWRLVESFGQTLVRHGGNDECRGHWIAVNWHRTGSEWEVWWVNINEENMWTFKESVYLLIDLLAVEIKERDRLTSSSCGRT